jgi:diadenosine tetraphosphate (Ap4A) HIT family hydrolase
VRDSSSVATVTAYDAAVPSLFTRIIDGELPGRFVWRDHITVAWIDIRPLTPGHTLVVPIVEVDRWTDLAVDTATHAMRVAHAIANAQLTVWPAARAGLMIAGFEVPHVHLHVFPTEGMQNFDFRTANTNATAADLDRDMHRLRDALRALGHRANVPD